MSSISGRIPVHVETALQKCLGQYASNLTSVLAQFPSQQVQHVSHTHRASLLTTDVLWPCSPPPPPPPPPQLANIINRHAASIRRQSDQDQFFMNTNGITQLLMKLVSMCLFIVHIIFDWSEPINYYITYHSYHSLVVTVSLYHHHRCTCVQVSWRSEGSYEGWDHSTVEWILSCGK